MTKTGIEEALLGAMLVFGEHPIKKQLHFQDQRHQRIWDAMQECEVTDQVSVAEKMNEKGTLELHDCAYLRHLVANCPAVLLDPEDYVSLLTQKKPTIRGVEF